MPQGGTVTLAVQTTATHVHLQVRDTGVGIPPERLAQLLEQLYRTVLLHGYVAATQRPIGRRMS